MKPFVTAVVLLFFTQAATAQTPTPKMDTTSYSLGVVLAQNLKQQGFKKIVAADLARGFEESLAGTASMTPDLANIHIQEHLRKASESAGAEARKEGETFLANNAKRPEVSVTASGLQYEVLKQGAGGKQPTATQTVEVHYHGTLIDGTVFDSSVQRGETISFPLNRVISGWTEGLQLMSEGDKYRFYIPYDLAYGERGSAPKIPPYAALIFDVELFKVK